MHRSGGLQEELTRESAAGRRAGARPTGRRITVLALGVVVALAVALFLVLRDGAGRPLEPEDDARLVLHLNGDHGLVDDVDPNIPLENPTEHPITITDVDLVAAPDSPGQVTVRSFRLAGPDRTTPSLSGGRLGAKDYGAPLLSADEAVIPAGAANRDYILLVRVVGDRRTDWSAADAVRITYEWNGEEHHVVWDRGVVYCSPTRMGRISCEELQV
ncbi:hypothetical protein [Nocardioides ochotonae]|uniref:hypothetical protein n=1 Tax=Nocardioides ochotonae TaxID=2685869 RepID=UPI00140DFB4F|nr:hypothetical protein [Nocardioides ochotonae]